MNAKNLLTECCEGNQIWLLCENRKCDEMHEFSLCEICGQTITDTNPNCVIETEKEMSK